MTTTQSVDAALVTLAQQLISAWMVQAVAVDSQPDTPQGEAACAAIMAIPASLIDRIEAIPASTLAGLGVKAMALAWTRGENPFGPELKISIPQASGETSDEGRLQASIARDIMAIGKSSLLA